MKYIIQLISLIAFVFTMNTALARKPKPPPAPEPVNLMNVVTVSEENGDFTNPVAAMNSICENGPGNRYLVVIGPGVYEVSTAIIMKEWVTIQGAGREATKITGAVSYGGPDQTSAIVKGQNNAALIDLTIENRGGGTFSIAIFNSDASPRIERVTAEAFGAFEYATGILNQNSSSPVMTNVSASAYGASSTENFGVYNVSGSSPIMVNVNANATGVGGDSGNSSIFIENSAPFIVDSVLEGSPGLKFYGDNSGSRIVNNMIIGGVEAYSEVDGVLLSVTPTSGNVCRGNYDENLMPVDCPTP
jgi:hypothetical protein